MQAKRERESVRVDGLEARFGTPAFVKTRFRRSSA